MTMRRHLVLGGSIGAGLAALAAYQLLKPEVYLGSATAPGELRAVVGLVYSGRREPDCTGSLIAPTMVLTAAHCVCDERPTDVFVGEDPNAGSGPTSGLFYRVVDLRVGYDCSAQTSATDVDVAVLELENAVEGTRPLPFADARAVDKATTFRVVGFGATDRAGRLFDHRKREAAVAVISLSCSPSQAKRTGCQVGEEIVAGKPAGPDTCVGDSGGPLLLAPDGTAGKPSARNLALSGVTSRSVDGASTACGGGGIYERMRPPVVTWISRAVASMSS